MPAIGIVDDDKSALSMLERRINIKLRELQQNNTWSAIAIEPLPEKEEYISWISEYKICALLIDERLYEKPSDNIKNTKTAINYAGHDLVDYLRQRFKDLPIFIITSHSLDDKDLQQRAKDVEDIISRNNFTQTNPQDNALVYVSRILRSSQKYLETFQEEFVVLSDVATKIATDQEVSPEEVAKAKAIQQKMEIAFDIGEIQTRYEWLEGFESLVNEMKELKSQMEQYLESKK